MENCYLFIYLLFLLWHLLGIGHEVLKKQRDAVHACAAFLGLLKADTGMPM